MAAGETETAENDRIDRVPLYARFGKPLDANRL